MSSWRDKLAEVEIEKRRWSIIAHLEKSKPQRVLSAEILIMGCRANGIPTVQDELEAALLWLEEQRYISTETLGAMQTAKLTEAGREVAQGLRVVPGLLPFGADT